MNYPEDAWLLLTHQGLFLMSSKEGTKYHEKLELKEELKMVEITSIEGVPKEWFKKPRNLHINFQKGEPSKLDDK